MVKRVMLFATMLVTFATTVFAADIYSNQVRQVYPFSDTMRVYTDVTDNKKVNVEELGNSNFQVYVDNSQMQVKSAKPFSETGEGTAAVFLVDTSKSLSNSQMKDLKAAMKKWVSRMTSADSMAIITFGNDVKSVIDYSSDAEALNSAINSITNDGSRTRLYGGISEALKLCSRTDAGLPKRKSIILITDGVNDYKGGISEEDVYSQLKEQLIPVYSLWLPTGGSKGEATLNSVTDYSGGSMYNLSQMGIESVYDTIYNSQMSTYVIDCAYSSITPDGNMHTLTVKAAKDGKTAEDKVSFNLVKNSDKSGQYMVVSEENNVESEITETAQETEQQTEQQDDAEVAEETNDEQEGGLSKTAILLICLAVVIIAVIITLVIVLVRRSERKYDDYTYDMEAGSTGYTYEKTEFSGATVNTVITGQRLVFTAMNGGGVTEVPFQNMIVVGRGSDCGFKISDPQVSSKNTVISFENGKLYIQDCGSTNGTFVNGYKISEKREFESGSVITVGLSEFKVELKF